MEDLLLWRDTKKSGLALGAVLAGYIVLNYLTRNPIAAIANALQLLVIVSFLWNNAAKFLHK